MPEDANFCPYCTKERYAQQIILKTDSYQCIHCEK
ncbi:MAG: hypothetical protein JW891_17640 [Candidatus Lokiarchaeota archaeon]|nr:hypothetical protein [Candidatus Lokiarchaeota archaeon]